MARKDDGPGADSRKGGAGKAGRKTAPEEAAREAGAPEAAASSGGPRPEGGGADSPAGAAGPEAPADIPANPLLAAPPPAAKAKAARREPAARAPRATSRSDPRPGPRRKPAKPAAAKPAHIPLAPAAMPPAAPIAGAPPSPAAAPTAAPPEGAQTGTAAFAEAAFGVGSRLPEQLARNIERIESLTQRLVSALAQRRPKAPGVEAPGPDLFATAASAWMRMLTEQPQRVLGHQVSYWGETLRHFAEAQAALARGNLAPPPQEGPKDRRFANPLWDSHPFFSFIRRQYQINADAMLKAASDLDVADMTDRRRIEWFTRQMIDMMSPTNFLATNPDALERAVATEGESLVRGLENLVRDVEAHGGELIVSLADRDAFRVGQNIATTPGRVVARTPLYELIQYSPATAQVHALPLVIFPPWINKFYILDLKPQNSLIRWIVEQGHTLFVVSWKNPDASYADTGMEDYVSAYLEVMDHARALTGQERLNVVGYCIAGTTLALTLALLHQRGDDRVNSASFLTTLTDFSDQGEFTAFLQEDFVSGIEEEAARTGVLGAALMTRTFSFLRANDLLWGPAIRSYMLGEPPPAFDLLFWNGDGTNLPGRMAIEYLRGLCQDNAFAGEGFELFGTRLRVSDVQVPLCSVACETDHIAPAADCWRGVALMGAEDKSFILSESGHVAGIVNPPTRDKYGHYTSDAGFAQDFAHWRARASFHRGSWWPSWGRWLAARAGAMVPAREPAEGLGPAPGEYVHERA